MATKKNVKKVVAPKVDITVDITDAKCAADVYSAFAWSKLDKHLTRDEFDAFVEEIVNNASLTVKLCKCDCCNCCEKAKKPNIFKRVWNWITGK